MIKVLENVGLEETHFNTIKVIYKEPTANIILNQWFLTYLLLQTFNAVPNIVVTPTIHLFHYYFITVIFLLL